MRDDILFYNKELYDVLRGHLDSAQRYVDKIPQEQFIGTGDETIAEHVFSEMEIQPIEVYEDRMEREQKESKMDVSGDWRRNPFENSGPVYVPSLRVTISIPFSGCKELWYLKPDHWRSSFPHGYIQPPNQDGIGCLQLILERPTDTKPEGYKQVLEKTLEDVRFYLEHQKKQLEQHHKALKQKINEAISKRRKSLEHHSAVGEVLNIPLKKREGVPGTSKIPIKRKLVKPLPAPPKKTPEPGITKEDYEHILSVIRHEGRSFESTPETFVKHNEEELRDIILAHLNGHYQGDATGETFRRSGKTDIRIENKDRAAFVAECKVWRGPSELKEAIEQLLGYLTWRDCKTSIVIFNKNVSGFTGIQQKISAIFEGHANYEKPLDSKQAGEWRFLCRSQEDPDRKVIIHVFLFNLYTGNGK
jgi:hypothetical protein